MIYFDNAATTRPIASIEKLAQEYYEEKWYNPSAMYPWAVEQERELARCRKALAAPINADPKCVIFNSCGTEGANTVIFKGYRPKGDRKLHFITSIYEHPCVYNSFKALEEAGNDVDFVSPRSDGHIHAEDVASLVREDTALVSIMHVNNETGAVNDVADIAHAAKEINPQLMFHSDGVQGYLKCDLDFHASKLDYYTVSAHKLHALKGTGALFYKKGSPLKPYIIGGGQEEGLRSGTENTFGAFVFAAAVNEFLNNRKEYIEHMFCLRDRIYRGLSSIEGVIDLCPKEDFAPHLVNVAIQGMRGEVLLHLLEKKGIAISTGSARSSKKKKQSRVHAHLKLKKEDEEGIIRISLCPFNTEGEVDALISAIKESTAGFRRYVRR